MIRTRVALFEGEFLRYRRLGEGAIRQLSPEQLSSGAAHENSIATIVWHISGNLRSRFTDFLTSDGEKPWREREDEFAPRTVKALDDLMERWDSGWSVLLGTLAGLSDPDLERHVAIRGVELRVDEALLRSLAHLSYHVGQIVHVGKRLAGLDWEYLSIPPGGTAAYNADPRLERAPGRE